MNKLFPTRTKVLVWRAPSLRLLSSSTINSNQRPQSFPLPCEKPAIAPIPSAGQARWFHAGKSDDNAIPKPTPFVPDVKTFLTLIGRDLHKHVEKIPSWEALFTLTSDQFQELGIEPPRTRKYLIQWRHKFKNGVFGVAGDAVHVKDGKAELRVLELERQDPLRPPARMVVNVPEGKHPKDLKPEQMVRVKGFTVRKANIITGPYALPLREDLGGGAYVLVKDGMWEHRRGHKVDGGERRRTETRFLKRVSQRRAKREQVTPT